MGLYGPCRKSGVPGRFWLEDAQLILMLVRRCQAGDAAAWEDIVQRFHRRIFNLCYRFTGTSDDAEDLTQEVFIKMYKTLDSYDPAKGAFLTWVSTMTRNLLVDHFRRTKLERLSDSMDATPEGEDDAPRMADRIADKGRDPYSQAESQEVGVAVHAALQKLSPDLREAVILRDLQDLDYREIAIVLKVPEGTVKSRINRGRAELGRVLQRTYRQVNLA